MQSYRKATTRTWAWTDFTLKKPFVALFSFAFFSLAGFFYGIVGAQETAVDDVAVFMRAKLDHSKNVLEGLALADFDLIARGAQELSLASQESSWQVLQTEDYARLSTEFRRACDGLRSAAKAENLDGAVLAWMEVTQKCVQCHRYIRDEKR